MAKSKETTVWWGRKEQIPLPKKPGGLGSSRLLVGPGFLVWVRRLDSQLIEGYAAPPGTLSSPSAEHQEQCSRLRSHSSEQLLLLFCCGPT